MQYDATFFMSEEVIFASTPPEFGLKTEEQEHESSKNKLDEAQNCTAKKTHENYACVSIHCVGAYTIQCFNSCMHYKVRTCPKA